MEEKSQMFDLLLKLHKSLKMIVAFQPKNTKLTKRLLSYLLGNIQRGCEAATEELFFLSKNPGLDVLFQAGTRKRSQRECAKSCHFSTNYLGRAPKTRRPPKHSRPTLQNCNMFTAWY